MDTRLSSQLMHFAPSTVLVVDDDPSIHALVRHVLGDEYTLLHAETGEEGIELVRLERPSVVLLDLMLPGISGYDVCRHMKRIADQSDINIIIVSGKGSRSEQLEGYASGADDYVIKPFDPFELSSRVRLHCRLQAAVREANSIADRLHNNQVMIDRIARDRVNELLATQDVTVFALAKVAESRDNETGRHLLRIRAYAHQVALTMADGGPYVDQITPQFLTDLYRSSPLHDIGKVGIPDSILLKPGPLTRTEFQIMRTHTQIGSEILEEAVANCEFGGFLGMAVEIARSHHERFDGLGYPDGIQGDDIPLAARIVSVVDVFDAVTSARPYKEPLPPEHAKQIIVSGSGTQFDPAIVESFVRCFDDLLRIGTDLHDDSNVSFKSSLHRLNELSGAV